jgi:tripartite-type tricarboxylate transporter receptor subunit TctC
MLKFSRTGCAAAIALLIGATADVVPGVAQTFPSGNVKLIVPVPAGGVTDLMARIVAQRLSDMWGQSVIVDNRPGGNYGVGVQAVSRAPADGYTLLVAPDSTFTANPALFSKLNYDPKEFTPIMVLCRGSPVLVVNSSVPANSVQEIIALAKSQPGKLNYGSFGVGTYAHLSMEDFRQRTGTDIVHVPYRGAAPALNGLLAGDVGMLLLNLSSVEAHEKTGKVKILAAATEKRLSARPELPTIAESGVPGFKTTVWFAMWGPPNMPPELVGKIHADVSKALDLPQSHEFFTTNSFERVDLSPAQFSALIESDLAHWTRLINAVGAKIE